MATRRKSPFVTPLAAAFVATLPLSLATAAGGTQAQPTTGAQAVSSTTTVLSEAERMVKSGRAVAARSLLLSSLQDENLAFGEADQERALSLLADATRQIRETHPLDLSLQRAHVALAAGDLRTAERHAKAIASSASAENWQQDQAAGLLKQVDERRSELAEIIPQTLVQAERDFLRGRYAQAVAGFGMVDRSGIELTDAQQAKLEKYQMQLVAMGDEHPELFRGAADMGVMQPGVVRRRDQQPAGEEPAGQPESQPPVQPPAGEPAQPTQPTQPEQPAGQPPAGAAPQQGQSEDQLLGQAMQFQAESELAQADRSFDAGRYNDAAARYARLSTEYSRFLSPEQLQHVQSRAAESRARMGVDRAMQPEQVLREREIAKQQAVARFEHEINLAGQAMQSGNIAAARDYAAGARLTLNNARQLMAEGEYEQMSTRVTDLLAEIQRAEMEQTQRDLAQQEAEVQRRTAEELTIQQRERDTRIMELIDRARAFQNEQRYQEALQTVEQLLFLEPNHATGLLLREAYQNLIIYRTFNEIRERRHINFAHQTLDNQVAAMPPRYLMDYPLDWPTLSVRRGEPVHFAESPENRRILADLDTRRIPTVAFADNALADVLQFLQTITQVNMDVDWQSLDRAGIQRETPITLNLNNVTARTLLERVVEQASGPDAFAGSRADWAVQDGMVIVASEERIRRNTALVIYDVRDLLIEVPDYPDTPQIDLNQALQGAGGGGGGGGQSPFQGADDEDDERDEQRREELLNDLIDIITENVDYEGWVDNGGDTGRIQRLVNNGNLIITNTPKNHRAISGLLSQLREIRAMQINVETRFLLVNQDWFEQIGFQLDVYFNAENNQVRTARGANPAYQASDMFSNGRLSRIISAPQFGVTDPQTSTAFAVDQPERWSPIGVTGGSLGLARGIAPQTDFSGSILGAAPALGIAGQFLDDIQVDFLIEATQADRRSVQLTAPRLTFTNGQLANIYVATQIAFVSDLEPIVGDSAVGFNPTIAVATEGVTLLVEGTVSADRRYVTMNVDAGVARIDGFANQSVSAVAGGQLVTSAAVSSFIQLPQVTVTRVRTTVTVPDQGTILMGGQRLTTEFEVETGVPVLSKLPILNRFFTNRIESKEEQTLLILIKPTILIQNEEEERHFPGLLESMRTGWGR